MYGSPAWDIQLSSTAPKVVSPGSDSGEHRFSMLKLQSAPSCCKQHRYLFMMVLVLITLGCNVGITCQPHSEPAGAAHPLS